MKEFNLKEAKAGKKVCTRDGREVEILKYNAKGKEPIIGLIKENGTDNVCSWHIDGKTWEDRKRPDDLMIAPEGHKAYVALYLKVTDDNRHLVCAGDTYINREQAENETLIGRELEKVKVTSIEWEE